MLLEDLALRLWRRLDAAAGERGHDLAEGCRAVLRLRLAVGPLDAQSLEIAAQARQGAFVEEAGQVIGRIGQQLAAPHAHEQIEVLPPHGLDIEVGGGLTERRVCHAERAGVAAQARQTAQELCIRRAREQRRQQRVFLGARGIHLVEGFGLAAEQIGAQHVPGNAGCGFYGQNALGRDALPVGYGRLRDPDAARKLGDAADCTYRLIEPRVPHLAYFLCRGV